MNLAMIQMLQEGDALDVSKIGSEIEPGVYQLTTFIDGIDYCDPSKDLWIWSIGKNLKSGLIYASMDTRYYFNDDYECLWLR